MTTSTGEHPRLAGAAAWTAIGLVLIGLVRAGARIGAGRFFGDTALAYVTGGLAVATIATVVGAAGLTAGATKLIAELRVSDDSAGRSMATLTARSMLVLTIAGALGAIVYAGFDRVLSAGGRRVILSTGLLTFTFGMYLAGKAILYGEGAIRRYVRREVAGAVAFLVAGGLVVAAGTPAYVLLPVAAAYLGVGSVALGRLRQRTPAVPLPVREYAGYGVVGAVGALAGVGFTSTTPLVAGFVAGAAGTALIGAVLTLVEPLYLAPRTVSLVLLPRISAVNARGDRDAAAWNLHVGTAAVTLIAAPACTILFTERDRLLQVLFGNHLVGGPTLGWFALAAFVSIAGAPAVTALAATDVRRATIPMAASLVGFATAGIVWLVAGAAGTVAIATGYAVGSVIQVVPPITVASVRYRPRWRSFWLRVVGGGVLVGGIALLPISVWAVDAIALVGVGVALLPEIRLLLCSLRDGA